MTLLQGLLTPVARRALALFFVSSAFVAVPVAAQEVAERWIPEELRLPDDTEVLFDRSLDGGYRMFTFRTGANTDQLLMRWQRALERGGYDTRSSGENGEGEFEFSGPGIRDAAVAVTPAEEWSLAVVEIEAALRL